MVSKSLVAIVLGSLVFLTSPKEYEIDTEHEQYSYHEALVRNYHLKAELEKHNAMGAHMNIWLESINTGRYEKGFFYDGESKEMMEEKERYIKLLEYKELHHLLKMERFIEMRDSVAKKHGVFPHDIYPNIVRI